MGCQTSRFIAHRFKVYRPLFTHCQRRTREEKLLKCSFLFTIAVLLDTRLNLIAQPETVDCQLAHIRNVVL